MALAEESKNESYVCENRIVTAVVSRHLEVINSKGKKRKWYMVVKLVKMQRIAKAIVGRCDEHLSITEMLLIDSVVVSASFILELRAAGHSLHFLHQGLMPSSCGQIAAIGTALPQPATRLRLRFILICREG